MFSSLRIINVSCAPVQHIIINSEEWCDTEDWSMLLKIQLYVTGIND